MLSTSFAAELYNQPLLTAFREDHPVSAAGVGGGQEVRHLPHSVLASDTCHQPGILAGLLPGCFPNFEARGQPLAPFTCWSQEWA